METQSGYETIEVFSFLGYKLDSFHLLRFLISFPDAFGGQHEELKKCEEEHCQTCTQMRSFHLQLNWDVPLDTMPVFLPKTAKVWCLQKVLDDPLPFPVLTALLWGRFFSTPTLQDITTILNLLC